MAHGTQPMEEAATRYITETQMTKKSRNRESRMTNTWRAKKVEKADTGKVV